MSSTNNTYTDGLIFYGVVSGNGNIYVEGATKDTDFYGTSPNTYTGSVIISAGNLYLNKSAGTNAVTGNITVGDACRLMRRREITGVL